MSPKQAAARLLLNTLKSGGKHPAEMTREEMTATLGSRISDDKREKVLAFVIKIETPFVERLNKLSGESDDAAEIPAGETTQG